MPTLKQLACHVERGPSDTPLREYNTVYGDGIVSTFVGVPSAPTRFSVHLQSDGFIAHGLAMFVFIDGVAQCNRNRQDLQQPGAGVEPKDTEVNFRVRQQETRCGDGQFVARDWKFERLNIGSADQQPPDSRARHDVGTIEVVVRRCHALDPLGGQPLNQTKDTGKQKPAAKSKARPGKVTAHKKDQTNDKASSLGGFGGLFDGTCEERPRHRAVLGLDGGDDWDNDKMPGGWNDNAWVQSNDNSNSWDKDAAPKQKTDNDSWTDSKHKSSEVRSKSGTGSHDRALDQSDGSGDSRSSHSSGRGIVINQYVHRRSDESSRSRSHRRSRAAPVSEPTMPRPSPIELALNSAPYPWHPSYHTQMHPDFAEFLAWKYGSSQADAAGHSTGFKSGIWNNPFLKYMGTGTYAASRGRNASNKKHESKTSQVSPTTKPANTSWDAPTESSTKQNDDWGSADNQNVDNNDAWDNAGDATNHATNDDAWGSSADNKNEDQGSNSVWDTNDKKEDTNGWDANGNKQEDNNDWGGDNAAGASNSWDNANETAGDSSWDQGIKQEENGKDEGNSSWGTNAPANDAINDSWDTSAKTADATDSKNWDAGGKVVADSGWEQEKKLEKASSRGKKSSTTRSAGTAHTTGNALEFDPLKPYSKPYWSAWQSSMNSTASASAPSTSKNSAKEASASRALAYPSRPNSPIDQSVATAAKLSHQMQSGKGAIYSHTISRPKYIDSMQKPYAVFIFKYRSNDMLREILGDDPKEAEFDRGSYRSRMMKCKKEDLLEELMKMKSALGYDSDSSVDTNIGPPSSAKGSAVSAAKSNKSNKSTKEKSNAGQEDKNKSINTDTWGSGGNSADAGGTMPGGW